MLGHKVTSQATKNIPFYNQFIAGINKQLQFKRSLLQQDKINIKLSQQSKSKLRNFIQLNINCINDSILSNKHIKIAVSIVQLFTKLGKRIVDAIVQPLINALSKDASQNHFGDNLLDSYLQLSKNNPIKNFPINISAKQFKNLTNSKNLILASFLICAENNEEHQPKQDFSCTIFIQQHSSNQRHYNNLNENSKFILN
ncbi:unnamed protein product [Paramecium sonneborni]|uniref:Uncharacterized protein n=1 Tax=Paramecium sonneborni TaxID=65129 RepID=A0A8S1PYQ5_9CILI|nr:unnamed protein product [Paramecium sonneborni]